jgi:hypothetical protein
MRILMLAALAAASFTAVAASSLLPAGSRDQVPLRVVSVPVPRGQFEHAPVSFSWPLDPAAELATPAPLLVESREYWQTIDGTELADGVAVELSSPGALIRLSPGRGTHHAGASAGGKPRVLTDRRRHRARRRGGRGAVVTWRADPPQPGPWCACAARP